MQLFFCSKTWVETRTRNGAHRGRTSRLVLTIPGRMPIPGTLSGKAIVALARLFLGSSGNSGKVRVPLLCCYQEERGQRRGTRTLGARRSVALGVSPEFPDEPFILDVGSGYVPLF